MKFRLLLITLLISTLAIAQKGTVKGILTDKEANNATLPFANALIKGTNIGTTSDENGNYELRLDPGTYTIIYSFLGYDNAEENITITANETITVNKALGSGAYTLNDVVVQAAANREKESALLLDQKNAVEIKQTIGAQELARKGVSDVATAVTKTTGITKQEGSGNIYVRGLGDRYNATTMNGLPIPSNDPENKNIDLEIFSTDIVEYISIDKVYGSRLFGDFAGGNVDIVSKDYSGKGMVRIDMGSNVNTNAVQDKNFRLVKDINSFGFSAREIPDSPLTSVQYETLQQESKMPYAGNIGLSLGDSYNIGSEGKLSLFATMLHANEFQSKEDGSAASGVSEQATGADGEMGLYGRKFNNYTSYDFSTNTTGMANIGFKFNSAHKLSLNSVFINTSNQSSEEYFGRIVDAADDGNGFIRRSTYDKNTLFINQLLGTHKLTDRTIFDWGVSHNTVDAVQPDRQTNQFNIVDDTYFLNSQSAPNNNRYFQDLTETETAANAAFSYKFKKSAEGEFNGKLILGYNGRFKTRDFEATQFNFDSANLQADPNNLDAFYSQENFDAGLFSIKTFRGGFNVPTALLPQTYKGEQTIHAGYLNIEYNLNSKFTASLGLRGESIFQKVEWDTQLSPKDSSFPDANQDELEKTAFLPSLILKYALNDKQNLRMGFSKTYTLPQFKERALFVYERITEVRVGNPDLYPSDNYNFDLKWEMFPKSEELISVTAFGKYILNPINEVTIASSTNDISYINTGDTGYVAGLEFEFRKAILNVDDSNNKLSAGVNASYMYTDQELDDEKVKEENQKIGYEVDFTNKDGGQFTGASPLLVNADITYSRALNKDADVSATLAYTYFSDRVYSLGTSKRGDLVDKEVGTLDFILKSKFNKNLGMGLSVKNILDPSIDRVQENSGGDVNVLSYKKGMNISLGINYNF